MEEFARVHDLATNGAAAGRLSVVSELCPAHEAIPDCYAPFLPDAVAMRGEWRTPTADELRDLIGTPSRYDDADIMIVRVSRLAQVLRNHLENPEDYAYVHKAVRDVRFVRVLDDCVDDLVPFCLEANGLQCQGPWVSPGSMRLVTHNMKLVPPLRVGLHVDNLDDLPLAERARARRRLCVNVGLRPRYLIFLRAPLSALAVAGALPPNPERYSSPAALVRAHLAAHLKQPAVRVRIDPDEAYIVNAEDVIHDAASYPGEVPDIALHYLGHFGVEPSDAASALETAP